MRELSRVFLCGLLLAAGLALLSGRLAAAQGGVRPAVEQRVWDALGRRGAADVLIVVDDQPDLSPAEQLPTKAARGAWVVRTLQDAADRSQPALLAELAREGVPFRRYWAVNAVRATVTEPQLLRLLAAQRVIRVIADTPVHGLDPQPVVPDASLAAVDAIEWGVSRVKAPWAWSSGYTGQGIVIAGQDTGYAWDHPALINAYRGYNSMTGAVSHDYNWHDSIHGDISGHYSNICGYNSAVPCDDHGHGTHTMGTMTGNDLAPASAGWPASAANAIGVAPGAKWIGCRNMDNGDGAPSTYIECFEWLIAPYPVGGSSSQGDPAKAPDVMNNSWGCPASEGCDAAHLSVIEPALNAADAAGIVVVVSAGNSGPSCSTVVDPPAIYPKAWAVGATTSLDALATFSSRGPVTYGGQTYLKPGISAPGYNVRSSVPFRVSSSGYAFMSGTSMAGPHVAGVTALLLSAQPTLRGQTGLVRTIIERTADPITNTTCGPATGMPNNSYGWGIANAQRAIESLRLLGILGGAVSDSASGAPLAGAAVALYPMTGTAAISSTVVDGAGQYSLGLAWGSYRVEADADGYDSSSLSSIYVVGGKSTSANLALARVPDVTDLRIGGVDASAVLTWTHIAGVDHYEVWRSTAPYFMPGAPDSTWLAEVGPPVSGMTVSYTDPAGIGGPEPAHYYVVRSVSAAGGKALTARQAGVFSYEVLSGDPVSRLAAQAGQLP